MSSHRFTAFDAFMVVVGALFFALSAACLVATVTVLAGWGDPDTGFPAGPGFIRFIEGFSLALFPVGALVTFATGWWFAGDQIKRIMRRRRED